MSVTTEPGTARTERTPAMISIRGVSKTFTRKSRVLQALVDADLEVPAGEFVSLIGPSGCGKSTLLKLMAGLISPTAGAIGIDGEQVEKPLAQVSVAFQKPTLLRWRNVMDNVCLPLDIAGTRNRAQEHRASELLAMMGLSGFEKHYPRELSGGMEQRVAIARSLIGSPSLLLMDEPFGALDEFTREDLNDELLTMWQSEPKTVVFVTHSISEAVFLSDRVVVMSARPGRVHDTIPIDLPRPRGRELRSTPEFYDIIRNVRSVLDDARGVDPGGSAGGQRS